MSDLRFALVVGLLVVLILMKIGDFLVTRGYWLAAKDILEIAKSYFELGRAQHRDARGMMARVETHTETVAGQVAKAVAPVPDATAKKVVDAIQSSESGTMRAVRPTDGGLP